MRGACVTASCINVRDNVALAKPLDTLPSVPWDAIEAVGGWFGQRAKRAKRRAI